MPLRPAIWNVWTEYSHFETRSVVGAQRVRSVVWPGKSMELSDLQTCLARSTLHGLRITFLSELRRE